MRGREKQRKNRKLKHKEEKLDKCSVYGYRDLTPYNAVQKMRDKNASIILQ